MKLYDLGVLPWQQTQLIYHALGISGEESIVICRPQEQYACVGFHQDLAYELDIDFCKTQEIGLFRREIGGSTVFLDQNQIFYQFILDRKKAPLDQRVFFKKFLEPIIKTYNALGIEAKYNPVSDLVVNGKKISGNGGGDLGNCKVMTGSMLLDFDYKLMCRILNLQSEKFRQNVCGEMKYNLTTVKKELGYIPDINKIKSLLIANLEDMFGALELSKLNPVAVDRMAGLEKKFLSENWLFKKFKHPVHRTVKIIEGMNLIYLNLKGVEIGIQTDDEAIRKIEVFSLLSPKWSSKLNKMLVGKIFEEKLILDAVMEIS